MSSDKLFDVLFQSTPDLILRWREDLPADAGGTSISAPVLKESRISPKAGLTGRSLAWETIEAVRKAAAPLRPLQRPRRPDDLAGLVRSLQHA